MARSKRTADALSRLAAAEQQFLNAEFLAPCFHGGEVCVRLAGIVCKLAIEPADFQGWGVFRPKNHSAAAWVRNAKLAERQRYLELFPLVRLILAAKIDDQWLAMPAHRGDSRFQIGGMVPVRSVEDDQLFDIIHARFDGMQFWYDGLDPNRNPANAVYLRKSLDKLVEPGELHRSGLTPEEVAAYTPSYQYRYATSEEARRGREETRLRRALEHAGAELSDFRERADVYTVTYRVDGRRHTSTVSKKDLTVRVAGICLSGEDENFDLQSLVGVIREGANDGGMVRVGFQGMPEDDYWRVHPRRG